MSDTTEKIGKWVRLGGGTIALVAGLWAGFSVLDNLRDEVGRLGLIVDRMDSMVVKNNAYRLRTICLDSGFEIGSCPLLVKLLGGEVLERKGEAAKLPEIAP